jgi:voltage-gated potassium channel
MSKPEHPKIFHFDLLIIVLSVYVLSALLVDTFFKLPTEVSKVILIVDDGICFIFLMDFFIRFYNAEKKLQFLKWGWIDLISSIPALSIARAGRLIRLFRLLRVLRAFRSVKVLIEHIFKNRFKGVFLAVIIITILVIIFSSISILLFEASPESNIKTAEDAVWWSIVTITSVGYGDKYPVTTDGRIIGVIVMFTGVGLFGTFTAYLASWFTAGQQESIENNKIDTK